tara:strand:+ start:430 stop:600 length:171 start_codon:yes stop_codon:yes gene_type:complete
MGQVKKMYTSLQERLQDDCENLTREEFGEKHGAEYLYIYDEFEGVTPTEPTTSHDK